MADVYVMPSVSEPFGLVALESLKNGTATLPHLYAEAGADYEDTLLQQAEANGIEVDQQRRLNMLVNLPQHVVPFVNQRLGEDTTNAEET